MNSTIQRTQPQSQMKFPSAPSSAQTLIGNAAGFQETFSSVMEMVRVLRNHIATSNSAGLLNTSYEFESAIMSLISQVATVADVCVDMEEEDSDYETTRSNVRFSLRTFLDTIEKRRLECASMCLNFVVDAMYAFMAASVQEVSRWKADHQPRLTFLEVTDYVAEEDEPLSPLSPNDGYASIPIRTRRPSILKRLRSLSALNVRRQSVDDRRCSALAPLMAEDLEKSRRIFPRPVSDPNPVPIRNVAIGSSSGVPDRLQRVIRRCKSAIKLPDHDGIRHQRNRSRTFTRARAFSRGDTVI